MSEPEDFVVCRICGKKLKFMTPTHLRTHEITIKGYRECWPKAPLSSGYHKKHITLGRARVHLKPQVDGYEPEDFIVCRVCGSILRELGVSHFRSKKCQIKQHMLGIHITSVDEYRKIYPDAPTMSENTRKKHSDTMKNGCAQEIWKFRRINDPTNESCKKGWHIRRKNDPKNTWIEKSLETRLLNDPEGKMYQKMINTKIEKYGTSLVRDPETTSRNKSLAQKRFYQNLTQEEKDEWNRSHLFKGFQHPNVSEKRLIQILSPLGFRYTGGSAPDETGHRPDFTHHKYPLIIEFDGGGGHNPSLPWVPENQSELDDQRDADHQAIGHLVLRLYPTDLKKGQLYIQQEVINWMSLNYSIEWEPFDVNDWFE